MRPLQGERLTRLPKAWQAHSDLPWAPYLKLKQYYWYVELPASLAITARLTGKLVRYFQAMTEGMVWLNRAILADGRRQAEGSRPERPAPMW